MKNPPYTLDHGRVMLNGRPVMALAPAVYGDGALTHAEYADMQRQIVYALNVAVLTEKVLTDNQLDFQPGDGGMTIREYLIASKA